MGHKLLLLLLLLPLSLYPNTLKVFQCDTNGTFTPEEIYEALGLKQPQWYAFWKDKRPSIHPKIVPSLQESLQNFYKSQGYYHVQIDKKEDNRSLTFVITPHTPVVIQSIKSDMGSPYDALITYKEHERFNANTFIDIKKNVKKKLLEEGYCNHNFDAKARVDLEKNSADILYHLQKNSMCHFGKITIDNPANISKEVIASRLYFAEGSPYSSKLIQESYSTISGLEATDGIQIIQDKKSDIIDLNISIRPKQKRIRQEIGVGYETNLGPKVLFRWQQRNFKGNAQKIAFDLKYSKKEKYLKSSYFRPAFMKIPYDRDYYLDLKNDFLYSEYEFENFIEKKYADYLHLLKDYQNFSIDLGLGLEKITIKKIGEVCNVSEGDFLLFFPFINLIIDHRDSKINPQNGLYFSAYLESGLKYLASSTSYSKLIFEGRIIHTRNRYTFAAKGKLGLISEFEKKLPESKHFFAGGSFSNRAYGYNRLGASDSRCDEVGAKTLLDTTLEVSHPLYKKLDAALFYDATMISEKSFRFSIDFVHALGMGLRYHTPIGPVKLDFGINIEHRDQFALHFQIGQSF